MNMLSRLGGENPFRFALFALLSGLLLLTAARSGEVYYGVTGLGDPAKNVSGDAASLAAAAGLANAAASSAKDEDGESQTADLRIEMGSANGAHTAQGAAGAAGYWVFHGADGADYANAGLFGGFNDVDIVGLVPNAGDRVVLQGNGADNNLLLRALHAKGDINVKNIKVAGGRYNGGLTETILGSEVGGAGMTLGGNGVAGVYAGPAAVNLHNVSAEGNSITVASNNTADRNAFGAGVLVNAHGSKETAPGVYELDGNYSAVSFKNVDLLSNAITYTNNSTGDVSVRGGGSRVAFAKSFSYDGGTVEGNTVTLNLADVAAGKNPHAAGGGLSVDGGDWFEGGTVSGVVFKDNAVAMNNNVTAAGVLPVTYARGGGFYFNATGTGTGQPLLFIDAADGSGNAFTGNRSAATAGAGQKSHAQGGGAFLFLNDIDASFVGTVFSENAAATNGGAAQGGALATGNTTGTTGELVLNGAFFDKNSAVGTDSAQGGAVFFNRGELTARNSSFTDNAVTAANAADARGGAVFMNTEAGSATLNLVADAGYETVFSGNHANGTGNASGIHFGNAWNGAASSHASALNIQGSGRVALLDPLSVVVRDNDFTMTKTDSGRLDWDGANSFRAFQGDVTIALEEGLVMLGRDFAARAESGTDNFTVAIGTGGANSAEVRFDAGRNNGLALFDFSNAGNGDLTATAGTRLVATAGSSIKSYVEDFVVVKGLDDPAMDQFIQGVDFRSDSSGYMSSYSGLWKDGDRLMATVRFDSPFERAGANSRRAVDSLDALVRGAWGQANIGQAEISAMYRNSSNIVPELFASQGNVMLRGVDRTARSAVDFGLRNPHRLRMRMENAYRPSGFSRRSRAPARQQPYPAAAPAGYQQQPYYQADPGMAGQPYAADPAYAGQQTFAVDPAYAGQQTYAADAGFAQQPAVYDASGQQTYAAQPEFQPFSTDPYASGQDYDPYAVQSGSAYPRLNECYSPPVMNGLRMWAGYVGDWHDMDSHGGHNGYKVDRNGFLIGVNYDVGTFASFGIYAGYTDTKTKAKGAASEVRSDTGHFGLQGRMSPLSFAREFSLFADMGYHYSTNDLKRDIGGWNTKGSFDQGVFTIGLGAEYLFNLGFLNLTPHADFRYLYLDQDSISETGTSSLVAHANGFNGNAFNHRVGLEVSKDFFLANMVVSPSVNVDWRHEYGDREHTATAVYQYGGTPFQISSIKEDRDSMDIGVAVKALRSLSRDTKLGFSLSYNYNVSRHSDTHSLYAGVELGF